MLHSARLGFAGGILWGITVFIMTVISIYTGYATEFLNILSGVYIGYTITWWGSVLALIYGFIDGFIGFLLLAWLYNILRTKKS